MQVWYCSQKADGGSRDHHEMRNWGIVDQRSDHRPLNGSILAGRCSNYGGTHLVQGAVVMGTAVTDPAVMGTDVMGTVVTDPAVMGTDVIGAAVMGTVVIGTVVMGTVVMGTVVMGTADVPQYAQDTGVLEMALKGYGLSAAEARTPYDFVGAMLRTVEE